MICTLCDPMNAEFIHIKHDYQEIIFDERTCSKIIYWLDFEYKLAYLYEKYIKMITFFTLTLMNAKEKHPKLIKKKYNLDIKYLIDNEEEFYKCKQNFTTDSYNCKMFCKQKNLFEFDFKIDFLTIFKNVFEIFMIYFN